MGSWTHPFGQNFRMEISETVRFGKNEEKPFHLARKVSGIYNGNFGSVESNPQLTKGMKEELMGAHLQTAERKK